MVVEKLYRHGGRWGPPNFVNNIHSGLVNASINLEGLDGGGTDYPLNKLTLYRDTSTSSHRNQRPFGNSNISAIRATGIIRTPC